jgi:thioredoxin-like negative regulator of GroEL
MVSFIKVDADKSSISQERGIRGLPTFHFFIRGQKVDELVGANTNELENKVKPLLPLLISRRDEFTRNMINNVLPLIDGKDLNTMIVFYEFKMKK